MTDTLALSAHDLARLLSVSVRTVWAWDSSGAIGPTATKLSERCSRWDRCEIEAWWALCRREGRRIGRQEWARLRGAPE